MTYEDWSDADLLEELDEKGTHLMLWEVDFVESLTRYMKNGGTLNKAQRAKLIQVLEERTLWS